MKEKLQSIREEALKQIHSADMPEKLNDVRVRFLGKKGELTAVLKGMKDVAAEERPKVGQMVNEVRQEIESILDETKKKMDEKIREEKIGMEKLHLIFADTRERDCREKELQQMFPNLSICHATPFNIEIISGRAGKGNALVALGKILGIKREEIMACGDAPNDWNMLEMAGLPVVMANADEETKKKAAFITKSNEEDGVAYAVEQFVLKNG